MNVASNSSKMKRAVFVDRDGTLNLSFNDGQTTRPPRTKEEIVILEGVEAGVKLLEQKGLLIVIVSNQPDFSRGKTSLENLKEINAEVMRRLGIRHSYICFHDGHHLCGCRKPKNGLLVKASKELNIDLAHSYLIGDRLSDMQAGIECSCRCFLLDANATSQNEEFKRVASFSEAVDEIFLLEANRIE